MQIAEEIVASGKRVFVVGLDPDVDRGIKDVPHAEISLGQVGHLLALLRANGCRRVVVSGGLARPDLRRLKVDLGFFRHIPTILKLMQGGDDELLRRVIAFFERQGFKVAGIPEVAPGLLAPEGCLTERRPSEATLADVSYGLRVIAALGSFDIGQAVAVRGGRLVAVEAAEGTDAMLDRLAGWGVQDRPVGGVLVKATKPGQELRVDLPTIGPRTVEKCGTAGLTTVAVEAGRSVILDRSQTIEQANIGGIAVLGCASEPVEAKPLSHSDGALRCLSRRRPDRHARRDARSGLAALWRISHHADDASMVVRRRHVLAVGVDEAAEAVLQRAGAQRQWGDGRRSRRSGILVLRDEQQATTAVVAAAAAIELAGIVVASGDWHDNGGEILSAAEQAGLFLAVAA